MPERHPAARLPRADRSPGAAPRIADRGPVVEAHDRLAALLAERGYDVTYRRHHGGHDQTSWTESLVDALPAIFPPRGGS